MIVNRFALVMSTRSSFAIKDFGEKLPLAKTLPFALLFHALKSDLHKDLNELHS